METSYSTLIIKITNKEAVADAGATGNFSLPGTPVNNLQPAIKPFTINIPDGLKISSTHMCNLKIEDISERENISQIVIGLSHASLISISILFDAGCKVKYDEKICSLYYNKKL